MNEIKPIKRSVQLQPLSREHHDGLLFSWKLKQGLENHTPTDTLKRFTSWYWQHHIKMHFYQEEKVLLRFMPATHPLAVQMKKDHDYIRELVLAIDREPDRQDFGRLAGLIERHIRFEERELFQHLEETLTPEQLGEILVLLEKHPVTCETEWKEEFWVRKEKP